MSRRSEIKSAIGKAKPPLGSGQRFDQLESKLAGRPGVRNPGALAASIGRRKLGAKRFASLAAHGKPGY